MMTRTNVHCPGRCNLVMSCTKCNQESGVPDRNISLETNNGQVGQSLGHQTFRMSQLLGVGDMLPIFDASPNKL